MCQVYRRDCVSYEGQFVVIASFAGKSVVVSGGTQGVGLATARLIAERGAHAVTICGRNEINGTAAAASLEDYGTQSLFVRADLARQADCFAVIDSAAQTFGRIDTLVNCCGSAKRGTLDDTTEELWDYIFAVNVRAPFFLIQRAVPIMRSGGRGGSIASIGSIAAHGGQPYLTAYCAAKAALVTLTKNLANSLRWDRIRVNALNIGWTATPTEHELQTKFHGLGEGWLERVSALQPFGRLLSVTDVAKALAFLTSDESGLMTGAVVDFDQTVVGTVDDNPSGKSK
jgi:NAD(P)-dependent dehydrogenase (short-subunit alcohol dehydrogenase family)